MRTVTLDILDDKALNLLKDLEDLKVIRLHDADEININPTNSFVKYKGLMAKQSIEEVEAQLTELRNEWN